MITTQRFNPTQTEFHTARHRLSVEQNMALAAVCPGVAAVKTKGRK